MLMFSTHRLSPSKMESATHFDVPVRTRSNGIASLFNRSNFLTKISFFCVYLETCVIAFDIPVCMALTQKLFSLIGWVDGGTIKYYSFLWVLPTVNVGDILLHRTMNQTILKSMGLQTAREPYRNTVLGYHCFSHCEYPVVFRCEKRFSVVYWSVPGFVESILALFYC